MKNFTTKTIFNLTLRTVCLFSLVIFLSAFTSSSNESLSYKGNSESKMKLSGYSKLDNWTMGFKSLNSEGSFIIKDGDLDEVGALQFDISTNMLQGEDAKVDSILYHTLANGEAQKISFKLTKQMVLPIMKKVHLIGDFTFAGVTRTISLQMSYEVDQYNNVKLNGTNTLLLSNFIDAATSAKLKAFKCSNQLTFTLELNLAKS